MFSIKIFLFYTMKININNRVFASFPQRLRNSPGCFICNFICILHFQY